MRSDVSARDSMQFLVVLKKLTQSGYDNNVDVYLDKKYSVLICTSRLVVPLIRLSTLASQAFLVVGPHIWNDQFDLCKVVYIPPVTAKPSLFEVISRT